MPIAPLVSPLRYDVVVRAEFFDLVASHPDPDSEEFVALAESSPYGTWFRLVAVPRFRARLEQDPTALKAAFAARVAGAVALWRDFDASLIEKSPLLLRRPARSARATTGLRVERPYHLADGGHRLALLIRAGQTVLRPSEYQVDRRRLAVLPDNTSLLAAALSIPAPELSAFRALGQDDPATLGATAPSV